MITRWYGYGIRWETRGMATGEKCSRKGVKIISPDSYINYSAAARRPLHTTSYPAAWTSDFVLSYEYQKCIIWPESGLIFETWRKILQTS